MRHSHRPTERKDWANTQAHAILSAYPTLLIEHPAIIDELIAKISNALRAAAGESPYDPDSCTRHPEHVHGDEGPVHE